MIEETEWDYVGTVSAMGVWFEEYVNKDKTLCKQVWNDGYTEIFEIN